MKAGGSSQKLMLFMRGKAMSGAPIFSGTNQLPNPPISAGMTTKNTMIRPCAVTTVFHRWPLGVPSAALKYCTPVCSSSRRITTDQGRDDGEHQVHRADVLVIRAVDVAPPAGRRVVVVVVIVGVGAVRGGH